MDKNNITIIKVFRVFFTIGTILAFLGSILNKEPIYVPTGLLIVGGAMIWFMGKRIKSLQGEKNAK